MKPTVALIGPGKVGCAMSRRLLKSGYRFTAVISRDQQRAIAACQFIGCDKIVASTNLPAVADAKVILLAVPDDQIKSQSIALQKAIELSSDQTLVHFSGLHPAELMRTEGTAAQLLSIHPLLPFADRQMATDQLPDCPCALEGDQSALAIGTELVKGIDGRPFVIASDKKALYHTSACIASNFLVTLLGTARDLLKECGIEQQQAITLLLPLVQASLDNTAKLGPEAGLTGPIVRGDCGTVEQHLHALKISAPNLLPVYRLLAEQTENLAVKSGRLNRLRAKELL